VIRLTPYIVALGWAVLGAWLLAQIITAHVAARLMEFPL
jgi:hypothetical protein